MPVKPTGMSTMDNISKGFGGPSHNPQGRALKPLTGLRRYLNATRQALRKDLEAGIEEFYSDIPSFIEAAVALNQSYSNDWASDPLNNHLFALISAPIALSLMGLIDYEYMEKCKDYKNALQLLAEYDFDKQTAGKEHAEKSLERKMRAHGIEFEGLKDMRGTEHKNLPFFRQEIASLGIEPRSSLKQSAQGFFVKSLNGIKSLSKEFGDVAGMFLPVTVHTAYTYLTNVRRYRQYAGEAAAGAKSTIWIHKHAIQMQKGGKLSKQTSEMLREVAESFLDEEEYDSDTVIELNRILRSEHRHEKLALLATIGLSAQTAFLGLAIAQFFYNALEGRFAFAAANLYSFNGAIGPWGNFGRQIRNHHSKIDSVRLELAKRMVTLHPEFDLS